MGKIFNVLGEVFPANQIERKIREMYAQNLEEREIISWIVDETDKERFEKITHSTLEGLAKTHLNLSAIIGKREEAKERRLVPEVVTDFFIRGGEYCGLRLHEVKKGSSLYRVGKVPRLLLPVGDRLEPVYGKLGMEYKEICFDKEVLKAHPVADWVTPGHPLFESVRHYVLDESEEDLRAGATFYDLQRDTPAVFDVFSAAVIDGLGNTVHERLFVVESLDENEVKVRQPTVFLDLIPTDGEVQIPTIPLPEHEDIEALLYQYALIPFLGEVSKERSHEVATIRSHLEASLMELINRENVRLGDLYQRQRGGDTDPLLPANIANSDRRLEELNLRRSKRLTELKKEETMSLGNIRHHGRALILPHPERNSPQLRPMRRDEKIEKIAIREAIAYEEARGYEVESVEDQDCGFDLKSRKYDSADPSVVVDVRFIEVKGRARVDDVFLSNNEYEAAVRHKDDYWLYAVYNCASDPELYPIQNPARMNWEPIVKVVHYQVKRDEVLDTSKGKDK